MDFMGVNGPGAFPVNAPAAPAPVPAEQRDLVRAVKAVNASEAFGDSNELSFSVDRKTGRAVVRIVNKQTREVVDQIPPDYVLRLAEELRQFNTGSER